MQLCLWFNCYRCYSTAQSDSDEAIQKSKKHKKHSKERYDPNSEGSKFKVIHQPHLEKSLGTLLSMKVDKYLVFNVKINFKLH